MNVFKPSHICEKCGTAHLKVNSCSPAPAHHTTSETFNPDTSTHVNNIESVVNNTYKNLQPAHLTAETFYHIALKEVESCETQNAKGEIVLFKLDQLVKCAEEHATSPAGYEEVLADSEKFKREGKFERSALLIAAARQGNSNTTRTSPNTSTTTPVAEVVYINMDKFNPPQDTFQERLLYHFTIKEDLEDLKKTYEERRMASGEMAYPLGMCVNCCHYHEERTSITGGQTKPAHACWSCDCVDHFPADENMNRTYESYHELAVAKGRFEYYENELRTVHPGDRWLICYGEHSGKKGVSLKAHRSGENISVSIVTDEGENFWIPSHHITRDADNVPPTMYDPAH